MKVHRDHDDDEATLPASGKGSPREKKVEFNDEHHSGLLRASLKGSRSRRWTRVEGSVINYPKLVTGSYKDALMRRPRNHPSAYTSQPSHKPSSNSRRGYPACRQGKRCFRCLASDHRVSECRDPVRCFRCWKTGHRAYSYGGKTVRRDVEMNREVHRRERAPYQRCTFRTLRNTCRELKCDVMPSSRT